MKKILFIIGRLHIAGGEQRSLTLLCNELVNRSAFDVTIACLESERPFYPLDEHVHIINLLDYKKSRAARFLYLLKIIRVFGYNLIVGYGMTARIFTGVIGCLFKIPVIFCERRYPLRKGSPPGKRAAQAAGIFLLRDKYAVFQSHDVLKHYKKLKSYAVIPNMLDAGLLPAANRWQPRKNVVVNAARCEPQKNQALLIDAFISAHLSYPNYKLEIYGDGRLKPELTEMIDRRGAGGYISINPPSSGLFEIMNNSKIYICSTDAEGEGYSNALLEAMAMGMASISTDCSGSVRDLIEDGVNGIIVSAGSADEMVKALTQLMQNDALAEGLAQRAISVREANAKEEIIDRWITFFNEVIE